MDFVSLTASRQSTNTLLGKENNCPIPDWNIDRLSIEIASEKSMNPYSSNQQCSIQSKLNCLINFDYHKCLLGSQLVLPRQQGNKNRPCIDFE